MNLILETDASGTYLISTDGNQITMRKIGSGFVSRPVRLAGDHQGGLAGLYYEGQVYYAYCAADHRLLLKSAGWGAPLLDMDGEGRIHQVVLAGYSGRLWMLWVAENEDGCRIHTACVPQLPDAVKACLPEDRALPFVPELMVRSGDGLRLFAAGGDVLYCWSLNRDFKWNADAVRFGSDALRDGERLEAEKARLLKEQDRLEKELERQAQERKEQLEEKKRLLDERDRLEKELQQQVQERKELSEEKTRLLKERDRLEKELEQQVQERKRLAKERDQISEKEKRREEENGLLREEHRKLQEETEKKLAYYREQIESAKKQYGDLMDVAERYRQEAIKWRSKLMS